MLMNIALVEVEKAPQEITLYGKIWHNTTTFDVVNGLHTWAYFAQNPTSTQRGYAYGDVFEARNPNTKQWLIMLR